MVVSNQLFKEIFTMERGMRMMVPVGVSDESEGNCRGVRQGVVSPGGEELPPTSFCCSLVPAKDKRKALKYLRYLRLIGLETIEQD